jgi:hypothetical protein
MRKAKAHAKAASKMHSHSDMDRTAYHTQNVTFRLYGAQKEFVMRAAQAQGAHLSEYLRRCAIMQASQDLGENPPDFPTIEKGRHSGLITKLARARGLTADEYQSLALQKMIEADAGKPRENAKSSRRLGVYEGGAHVKRSKAGG